MSHFSLLVIGDNIEDQLAPFQENNMGNCPSQYLEFNNIENEYRNDYETKSTWEFYSSSTSSFGQCISKANLEILEKSKINDIVTLTIEESQDRLLGPSWSCNNKYKCGYSESNMCPKTYIWIECLEIIDNNTPHLSSCYSGIIKVKIINDPKEIPLKDVYDTYEKYLKEYRGYTKDKQQNAYGYWENPNAQWDYWRIGGRWAGKFKLKPNVPSGKYQTPEFSWEWNDQVKPENVYDQVNKGDIDFETIQNEKAEKAAVEYDTVHSIIDFNHPHKSWEEVRKKIRDSNNGKEDIIKAREVYWSQPICRQWKNVDGKTAKSLGLEGIFFDGPEDYINSRQNYIDSCRLSAITTFAVLKDGQWYERGDMGWFGIVCEEKDQDLWNKEFNKLIMNLPDDTLLTVVDCHI